MKKAILILVLLGVFGLTVYINLDHFHAKFYNRTGEDIDALMIGKKMIGHLEKNEATGFVDFTNFQFDSGYPYEKVSGIIQGKKMTFSGWSWCASERRLESKGTFEFDIDTHEGKDGKMYLYLKRHKE
jgi:hypothetical protein